MPRDSYAAFAMTKANSKNRYGERGRLVIDAVAARRFGGVNAEIHARIF